MGLEVPDSSPTDTAGTCDADAPRIAQPLVPQLRTVNELTVQVQANRLSVIDDLE
jgi:hypothetical protein